MEIVEATAGPCRLHVVLSASRGWHRDLIRSMTKPEERSFVVFRGKIYAEQPMLLTVFDFSLVQASDQNWNSSPCRSSTDHHGGAKL